MCRVICDQYFCPRLRLYISMILERWLFKSCKGRTFFAKLKSLERRKFSESRLPLSFGPFQTKLIWYTSSVWSNLSKFINLFGHGKKTISLQFT